MSNTPNLRALTFDGVTTLNASTLNSATLNGAGYSSVIFYVRFGAIASTGGLTTAKLQTSDNGSTWVDVTGGAPAVLPGDTADDQTMLFTTKTIGLRRDFRLVLASTVAVATVVNCVVGFGCVGSSEPAANQANFLVRL